MWALEDWICNRDGSNCIAARISWKINTRRIFGWHNQVDWNTVFIIFYPSQWWDVFNEIVQGLLEKRFLHVSPFLPVQVADKQKTAWCNWGHGATACRICGFSHWDSLWKQEFQRLRPATSSARPNLWRQKSQESEGQNRPWMTDFFYLDVLMFMSNLLCFRFNLEELELYELQQHVEQSTERSNQLMHTREITKQRLCVSEGRQARMPCGLEPFQACSLFWTLGIEWTGDDLRKFVSCTLQGPAWAMASRWAAGSAWSSNSP